MNEESPQTKEINKIQDSLERAKSELAILYEISNAMRTTLKLDEILYIILTGVTAHIGLSFNRAVLMLVNEKSGLIEGKLGLGPGSEEEADGIWKNIEQEKMDLEDLINAYKISAKSVLESPFNRQVERLKLSLHSESGGLLASSALDGMPLLLTKDSIKNYANDPLIKLLNTEELALAPLKAKDKVNGLILADNFITKKPISKDDMRMLIMLANQAGLAIENSQLYENALIRSHTDLLTNLWNHGYFQFLLQAELDKAKANKTFLSLVSLDIDDFKIYNDMFGHQAGDRILKELSDILKSHSRKMDFVCRYGGEEFSIILPQTQKNEAFFIAERFRKEIEKFGLSQKEMFPDKRLTVSLGVASFPEDGDLPSDLISCSDKALYQAKKQGKNTTCC
ncbi:MAG: sensor domain-containing diguanylate cyclase [Candidatus Omnitrophica bacterium]|nr:sensor domain-containing diguanylate cyclase [Candidatus Omnitrophota bacterium]